MAKRSGLEMLKIEFVLSAMKLAQSFAHLARTAFQTGDYEDGYRNKDEAEYFYAQAQQMVRSITDVDGSLLVDLAELRIALDQVHLRSSATA